MPKEYLGDAVYVDIERGMVKLTVEYGDRPGRPEDVAEIIYLEREVYKSLVEFVKRVKY
jgi:hypothetical protein